MAIADLAGLELDDWQDYCLRVMLAESGGEWDAFEFGLMVGRQNGKTHLLSARILAGLFGETMAEQRVQLFTAHEAKTARTIFRNVVDLVRYSPLRKFMMQTRSDIPGVRSGTNEMSLTTADGRRAEFLTRTSGSARGYTGDTVYFDEAYDLKREAVAAIFPILSARPKPQIVYASMGPMSTSEYLMGLQDRARAGAEALSWLEWSADPDLDLDDETGWAQANPAVGSGRMTIKFLRKERGTGMGDEEFAREALCLPPGSASGMLIDPDAWIRCVDSESVRKGPPVFAVDTMPDRSYSSIAVAADNGQGRVHGELVDHRPGTEWVKDRLIELAQRKQAVAVVIDPGSFGQIVGPVTAELGDKVKTVSGWQVAAASGLMYEMIHTQRLAWRPSSSESEDYHVLMDQAVAAARKRTVGESWAWHRRDTSADISPLYALSFAVYGLANPPTSSKRPGKVRIMS